MSRGEPHMVYSKHIFLFNFLLAFLLVMRCDHAIYHQNPKILYLPHVIMISYMHNTFLWGFGFIFLSSSPFPSTKYSYSFIMWSRLRKRYKPRTSIVHLCSYKPKPSPIREYSSENSVDYVVILSLHIAKKTVYWER